MRESVYDAEISPLMAKIIEICHANDIPIHATFVLDDNDRVGTHFEGTDKSAMMRMFYYLHQAGDNIDAFLMAVQKDAEKYGHDSVYLRLLEIKSRL